MSGQGDSNFGHAYGSYWTPSTSGTSYGYAPYVTSDPRSYPSQGSIIQAYSQRSSQQVPQYGEQASGYSYAPAQLAPSQLQHAPEVVSYFPPLAIPGGELHIQVRSTQDLTQFRCLAYSIACGTQIVPAVLSLASFVEGYAIHVLSSSIPASTPHHQNRFFLNAEDQSGASIFSVPFDISFPKEIQTQSSGPNLESSHKRKSAGEMGISVNTAKRRSPQHISPSESSGSTEYSSREGLEKAQLRTKQAQPQEVDRTARNKRPSALIMSTSSPGLQSRIETQSSASKDQGQSSPGYGQSSTRSRQASTVGIANPPLIRTSTLQSPQSPGPDTSIPSPSFNPYGIYPQNRAVLRIDGDLESMSKDWTEDERKVRRRLIEFNRSQSGNTIKTSFHPVTLETRAPNSICISCIWWKERQEAFVTSVDTIYLLESLVAVRFTVEEKNRIRRNLEGFRPLTVAKGKDDSDDFFKRIMGFPNPKPRNIEKDVKVFPWRILTSALKKIIGKYSASYSSTAGTLSPPAPPSQGHSSPSDLPDSAVSSGMSQTPSSSFGPVQESTGQHGPPMHMEPRQNSSNPPTYGALQALPYHPSYGPHLSYSWPPPAHIQPGAPPGPFGPSGGWHYEQVPQHTPMSAPPGYASYDAPHPMHPHGFGPPRYGPPSSQA